MGVDKEQWKSTGDCSICRRRNYCSKRCRANKMAFEAQMLAVLDGIPSYKRLKRALDDVKQRLEKMGENTDDY